MIKHIVTIIFIIFLASGYEGKPCEEFKSVFCTRSMRLEVSAAKLVVYPLMTLYDCNDYYKEEYMTYDLFEICESKSETTCASFDFSEYVYENCINLREGKDCSVEIVNDKIDNHKIRQYIYSIKGENDFEMRIAFTTTNDTFTKEYTLKDTTATARDEQLCQIDEISYNQTYSPDNVKIDIEIDNVQPSEGATLYFRPRGTIQVLKDLTTRFKYDQDGEHHITYYNSSNTEIQFRLFKWLETSEGQVTTTRLDTYEYICGNTSYSDQTNLTKCFLVTKGKFIEIEFFMNFRLGMPDLLPYTSLIYDPDLSVIFHGAKESLPPSEVKKLKIAYIVAPIVVVVVAAGVIVGIVLIKKRIENKRRHRTQEAYEPSESNHSKDESVQSHTSEQRDTWKNGKKPE